MAFWDFLTGNKGYSLDELARRLGMSIEELQRVEPEYREFRIPKRSGGTRTICAPTPKLKVIQKCILHRLLGRLRAHPNATGFEKGHSIVTNAVLHAGKAVVICMDIQDFFASTSEKRVNAYFRKIGWNKEAANMLTRLCVYQGGLPQGAPTSPRLSNLVNYILDARLAGLAARVGAAYSRYADDLTFSFAEEGPKRVFQNKNTVHRVKRVLEEYGYRPHHRKKLHIRRRHQCQRVTGLVVNERPALPRKTRRWIRSIEHHLAIGSPATLSPQQLQGWRAYASMVETQREALGQEPQG